CACGTSKTTKIVDQAGAVLGAYYTTLTSPLCWTLWPAGPERMALIRGSLSLLAAAVGQLSVRMLDGLQIIWWACDLVLAVDLLGFGARALDQGLKALDVVSTRIKQWFAVDFKIRPLWRNR